LDRIDCSMRKLFACLFLILLAVLSLTAAPIQQNIFTVTPNMNLLSSNYYGTTGTSAATVLTNTLGQLYISNYVNTNASSGGGGGGTIYSGNNGIVIGTTNVGTNTPQTVGVSSIVSTNLELLPLQDFPATWPIAVMPTPVFRWDSFGDAQYGAQDEQNFTNEIHNAISNNSAATLFTAERAWAIQSTNWLVTPNLVNWPHGMQSNAQYAHNLGKQFGVYVTFDTNSDDGWGGIGLGYSPNWDGILQSNAQLFASWNIDFVLWHGTFSTTMFPDFVAHQMNARFAYWLAYYSQTNNHPISTYLAASGGIPLPNIPPTNTFPYDTKFYNVVSLGGDALGDGGYFPIISQKLNYLSKYSWAISPGHYLVLINSFMGGGGLTNTQQGIMGADLMLNLINEYAQFNPATAYIWNNSNIIRMMKDPSVIPGHLASQYVTNGWTNYFTATFTPTVSVSRSANVATIQFNFLFNPAPLVGEQIVVTGISEAGFNGTYAVSGVGAGSNISYANIGSTIGSTPDVGGTVVLTYTNFAFAQSTNQVWIRPLSDYGHYALTLWNNDQNIDPFTFNVTNLGIPSGTYVVNDSYGFSNDLVMSNNSLTYFVAYTNCNAYEIQLVKPTASYAGLNLFGPTMGEESFIPDTGGSGSMSIQITPYGGVPQRPVFITSATTQVSNQLISSGNILGNYVVLHPNGGNIGLAISETNGNPATIQLGTSDNINEFLQNLGGGAWQLEVLNGSAFLPIGGTNLNVGMAGSVFIQGGLTGSNATFTRADNAAVASFIESNASFNSAIQLQNFNTNWWQVICTPLGDHNTFELVYSTNQGSGNSLALRSDPVNQTWAWNYWPHFGNGGGLTNIPVSGLQLGQVNTVLGSNGYTGNINVTNVNTSTENVSNTLNLVSGSAFQLSGTNPTSGTFAQWSSGGQLIPGTPSGGSGIAGTNGGNIMLTNATGTNMNTPVSSTLTNAATNVFAVTTNGTTNGGYFQTGALNIQGAVIQFASTNPTPGSIFGFGAGGSVVVMPYPAGGSGAYVGNNGGTGTNIVLVTTAVLSNATDLATLSPTGEILNHTNSATQFTVTTTNNVFTNGAVSLTPNEVIYEGWINPFNSSSSSAVLLFSNASPFTILAGSNGTCVAEFEYLGGFTAGKEMWGIESLLFTNNGLGGGWVISTAKSVTSSGSGSVTFSGGGISTGVTGINVSNTAGSASQTFFTFKNATVQWQHFP
jgi:hypothetical protein